MFAKLSLKTKLVLLLVMSVIGMVLLTGLSAWGVKRDLTDGRKAVVKAAVESAFSIAANYQALSKPPAR